MCIEKLVEISEEIPLTKNGLSVLGSASVLLTDFCMYYVTLYESGVTLVEKLKIPSPLQNVLAESYCRRATEEESFGCEVSVILSIIV